MADIFLCHNSADKEEVKEVANRLENEGISVWLDVFNLIPGERFTPKIEEALDDCGAIAVFVGQMGRGPYQNEEFDYAVNVRGTNGARIIPVLLPGAAPDMVKGFLRNYSHVQFQQSLDELEPFRMLVAGIKGVPPDRTFHAAPRRPTAQCPYRPLAAFNVTDHEYFFGRDQLSVEIVSRMEATINESSRCFSILGASGSGKSSLARAGVLWSLQQKHPDWKTVILEPGVRPHETLAERMLRLIHDQVDGLTLKTQGEAYLTDRFMLQRSVTGALGSEAAKGRLILLVDQFEEVFTICESEKAREAFIANLLTAARNTTGKTIVLLCLRADFYENCAKTELADVLSKQQILVGPLKRDELRSAIRDPAVRAGFEVESDLVTSLIKDCEEQPSPLPLLQIVLEKLWRKRDAQGRLTLAAYEAMSFEGALDEHAEGVYDKLLDRHKMVCQSLMLQMVEPIGDGRYTRRRVPVDSLLPAVDPKNEASVARFKQVETVLGLLSGQRARLMTVRVEGGTPQAELAHESLLRGWKRLASWLDQDSEFLTWKRRLRFELADWKNPKTPGSYLTGGVLDRARTWLRERPGEHTDDERRFINASLLRRLLWRSGLGAASAVVAAVVVVGVMFLRQSQTQHEIDLAVDLLAKKPAMALLVAYDAAKHEQSERTREALQRAVQYDRPPLLEADGLADISLSPDGRVLAAACPDQILLWSIVPDASMIWPPSRIGPPKPLPFKGRPTKVAISPDSKLIAAGDDTGKVMVWRWEQPAPGALFATGSKIVALAFAADGHLAITTKNKEVVWWSSVTGTEESRVSSSDEAWSLALSPDSSTIAAAMIDGVVRFWKPPATDWHDGFRHEEKVLNFVGYAKDGRSLGSGARLGRNVYRWNAGAPTASATMHFNEELTDSEAMDDQGHFGAHTTSESIVEFNAETGRVELYIPDQARDIFKIAMNSAGTVIAAAAPNGVRIYELPDQALAARARFILHDFQIDKRDCEQFLKPAACQADLKEISQTDLKEIK